jgi:hypothetical protein
MRSKWAAVAILVVILPLLVIADNQPNLIKKSELNKHSFTIGSLKLTITKFRASRGFTAYGPSAIEVKVENSSDGAEIFNPQFLSLAGKDNRQVNIRGQIRPNRPDEKPDAAQPKNVAAGAWIKESYQFYDWVRLPARIFYDGKELAVITD